MTPTQRKAAADDLRSRIKTLAAFGLKASATALRRRLRALLGGYELDPYPRDHHLR